MFKQIVLALVAGCIIMPTAAAQKEGDSGGGSGILGGTCVPGATTLCIPLDGTFTVVRMDASTGGNGQADPLDPCQRNDDDSSLSIPLQFNFDFYGSTFTDVFINNNGNVSFGAPFSTFTSTGFPVNGFPMLAPFWADVDTRDAVNDRSGVVYFKSEPNRFTVIWEHVGYFAAQFDKLNTFELIMTDGTDPLVGIGNNVGFCYDDMQWTTGSASGGSGGFGGVPATVGANKGDGVTFFQIGRFDHAGNDYDGPGGNADGVSFLDNTRPCFSTLTENIPPIFQGLPPNNKIDATVGVTTNFTIQAISPELNQTASFTVNTGGLANFSSVNTPGNPASSACTFTPDQSQVGSHIVTFVATDDGIPPESSTVDVEINVTGICTVVGFDIADGDEVPQGTLIDSEYSGVGVLVSGVSFDTGSPGAFANRQGPPGSDSDDIVPSSRPNCLTTMPNGFDPDESDFGRIRFDFVDPITGAPRSCNFVSLTFIDVEDSGTPGRGSSFLRGIRGDASIVDVPVPAGGNGGATTVQVGNVGGSDDFVAVEAYVGDAGDSAAIDDLCFNLNPPAVDLACTGGPTAVAPGAQLDFYIGLRNNAHRRITVRLLMTGGPASQANPRRTIFSRSRVIPSFFDNTRMEDRYHLPIPIPPNPRPRIVGVPLQIQTRVLDVAEGWEYARDRFIFMIE